MTKKQQRKGTQLHDLIVELELNGGEMSQVRGGANNLNLSKTSVNTPPPVLKCSRCGKLGVAKDPCCLLN